MPRSLFVLGLSALFAGMTALLTIGGIVSAQPITFAVAVPLGVTSYFMYYHGSGKLARAVYRSHEAERRRQQRGGFGAGPRDQTGPQTRADRQARARAQFRDRMSGRSRGRGRRRVDERSRERTPPPTSSGPTRSEAREVLGVGVRADQSEIKQAYREKVKEAHPDRGGDEAVFKQVTAAYDRLSESASASK